jgi:hypothetical protein
LLDKQHAGQAQQRGVVGGVHLLAAIDRTTRAVLAQCQVDGSPGEVPGLQPLLGELELAGVVVTADALQTHLRPPSSSCCQAGS